MAVQKSSAMGLDMNGSFLHTLLFADDHVLIAIIDLYDLYMMRKITKAYSAAGLKINFSKTKYLAVNSSQEDLEIDGRLMAACEDYTYLGAKISKEGSSKKEVSHRADQARYAISRLNTLLWSNNLSK
nr:unnamed protein product [Callosobruchus chinensis]